MSDDEPHPSRHTCWLYYRTTHKVPILWTVSSVHGGGSIQSGVHDHSRVLFKRNLPWPMWTVTLHGLVFYLGFWKMIYDKGRRQGQWHICIHGPIDVIHINALLSTWPDSSLGSTCAILPLRLKSDQCYHTRVSRIASLRLLSAKKISSFLLPDFAIFIAKEYYVSLCQHILVVRICLVLFGRGAEAQIVGINSRCNVLVKWRFIDNILVMLWGSWTQGALGDLSCGRFYFRSRCDEQLGCCRWAL